MYAFNPDHQGQHWVHFASQVVVGGSEVEDEQVQEGSGADEEDAGAMDPVGLAHDLSEEEELESEDDVGLEDEDESMMSLEQAELRIQEQPEGCVEGSCSLLRLGIGGSSGLAWHEFVPIDAMHTIGGCIRDIVLGTLTGSRYKKKDGEGKAREAELLLGGGRFSDAEWDQGGPGCLDKEGLQLFKSVLYGLGKDLKGDAGRLTSLFTISRKVRTHTLFLLAGPIGLYALACVRHKLKRPVYVTLQRLLQVMHLLWAKEVPAESVPTLRALVLEAVAAVELYLPVWHRDIKLHLLTQLPNCIEQWGKS